MVDEFESEGDIGINFFRIEFKVCEVIQKGWLECLSPAEIHSKTNFIFRLNLRIKIRQISGFLIRYRNRNRFVGLF